jgi:hypothetical protein
MAADWDDMLAHPPTTILAGAGGPGDVSRPLGLEPVELLVPTTPAEMKNTSDHRRWLWIGVGFASVLVIVTGVWVVASLRRKKPDSL